MDLDLAGPLLEPLPDDVSSSLQTRCKLILSAWRVSHHARNAAKVASRGKGLGKGIFEGESHHARYAAKVASRGKGLAWFAAKVASKGQGLAWFAGDGKHKRKRNNSSDREQPWQSHRKGDGKGKRSNSSGRNLLPVGFHTTMKEIMMMGAHQQQQCDSQWQQQQAIKALR